MAISGATSRPSSGPHCSKSADRSSLPIPCSTTSNTGCPNPIAAPSSPSATPPSASSKISTSKACTKAGRPFSNRSASAPKSSTPNHELVQLNPRIPQPQEVVMSISQSFREEFEAQAPVTRKFLERLPEDKLTWKPHDKSMTAGQLAFHIASVPGGIVRFVQANPAQAPAAFTFPQPASRAEILAALDESVATVRSLLPKFDDHAMTETWR